MCKFHIVQTSAKIHTHTFLWINKLPFVWRSPYMTYECTAEFNTTVSKTEDKLLSSLVLVFSPIALISGVDAATMSYLH